MLMSSIKHSFAEDLIGGTQSSNTSCFSTFAEFRLTVNEKWNKIVPEFPDTFFVISCIQYYQFYRFRAHYFLFSCVMHMQNWPIMRHACTWRSPTSQSCEKSNKETEFWSISRWNSIFEIQNQDEFISHINTVCVESCVNFRAYPSVFKLWKSCWWRR